MEESTPRWRHWASNNRLILIAGAIVVGALALVAVISALVFFRSLSRPGEATARYLPSDTLAYASINLRPGVQQLRYGRGVIATVQTDAMMERRDDLLDELEDETDIHFLDDMETWLGESISFALLDVDDDAIEWVAMAHVSDRDSALDFAEDLVSYFEDEFYTDFDDDGYRGADLWLSDDGDIGFALTAEYLLVADSEDTLRDVIRDLESPPAQPLLADEEFVSARELLPPGKVVFMFLRSEWILDLLRDEIDPFDERDADIRELEDSVPEYLAMSMSFIERGLRVDFAAQQPDDGFIIDSGVHMASPETLPADTLLLLATDGIKETWEEFRRTVEDLDPDWESDFLRLWDELEYETGIDIEDDVVDSLNGEIALALLPGDFRAGAYDALLLASVRDAEGIRRALESLVDTLADSGVDVYRSSLGDYEVVTLVEGSNFLGESYEPGYLVTEDWAVMGSTYRSMREFHDVATGDSEPLSSDGTFSALMDMAPTPHDGLLYANLATTIALLENALDSEIRSDFERDYKPFVENLEAFLLASSFTEETIRVTAILTLSE